MTWLILINRDSPIMDTHVVIICIWCGYNGFIEIDILASCTVDNREEYRVISTCIMAKSSCMQSNVEGFFVEVICPSWQLISHSDGKLISDSSDTVRPNFRYFYCSVAFSRFHLYRFFFSLYTVTYWFTNTF